MTDAPLFVTIPLAVLLLVFAVPAAVTGHLGWRGRLDRRGRLGLHTPAAQASTDAFVLANRVSAPLLGAAGAVGVVCAALTLFLPIGVVGAVIVAVVGLVGVFGLMAAGSRLGEAAARTVPLPARKPEGGGCCGGCGDGGCQADSGAGAPLGVAIPDLVADATVH